VNSESFFTNAEFRATFYMNYSLLEVDFPILDTFYVALQLTIFNFLFFVIVLIFICLPALNSEIGSTFTVRFSYSVSIFPCDL
jgi:hypothetical protein